MIPSWYFHNLKYMSDQGFVDTDEIKDRDKFDDLLVCPVAIRFSIVETSCDVT